MAQDLVVMTREDLDNLVVRLGGALADSTDAPIVTILDVMQESEPRLVEAYDVAVTLTTLEEVEEACNCPDCLRFPWEQDSSDDDIFVGLERALEKLSFCDCE